MVLFLPSAAESKTACEQDKTSAADPDKNARVPDLIFDALAIYHDDLRHETRADRTLGILVVGICDKPHDNARLSDTGISKEDNLDFSCWGPAIHDADPRGGSRGEKSWRHGKR